MSPEALIRLAELDSSICIELDLHESSLQIDPTRHLAQAVVDCRKQGKDVLKVIHGRGTGILQAVVRRYLEREQRQGRIQTFRPSDRLGELGAVIYVVV
jgi:DNA-nicking Smr family endonuclease